MTRGVAFDDELEVALLLACICSLAPATAATWGISGGAWLAAWGWHSLFLGGFAVAIRRSPMPGVILVGVGTGLVVAPVLVLFGELLHRATHHRPLGAATYVVGAGVLVIGTAAALIRLQGLAARSVTAQWVAYGVVGLGALATVALVGRALLAGSSLGGPLLEGLVAALAWVGAATLPTSWWSRLVRPVSLRRWLPVVGWGLVALAGVAAWLGSTRVRAELGASSVLGGTLGLLGI